MIFRFRYLVYCKGCITFAVTNVKNTQEMGYKCFFCGSDIALESNAMLSDFDDGINQDDDCTITYAHCPNCGWDYEFCDTPESQKKDFPFWQSNTK